MKVKILNPRDFNVKVISIDKKSLLDGTLTTLKGYHTYTDKELDEHLYNCNVREEIEQYDFINGKVSEQLKEIEEFCNQNDAAYYRTVNL